MEKEKFSARKKKIKRKGNKMYKEFIIIIIVIALVISLDILTNNYTKNTVAIMSEELNILRKNILDKNTEEAQAKMLEIKEKWEKRYNVLAYYIEHDELEKVETQLTALAADLNSKELPHCINDLDTTIFILEHIQEKEKFDLKSIF